MKQYVKKPVIITAFEYTGINGEEIEKWSEGKVNNVFKIKHTENGIINTDLLQIETLEGVMTAEIGDYIIKGIKGEFYPCKPDIFKETYDQVFTEIKHGWEV